MVASIASEFVLRDDVVFLTHGTYGACPLPVLDAWRWEQLELEREPVDRLSRTRVARLDEVRAQVEEELGAAPGTIVFVPNATHGLNVVARSISLEPGDEILMTDHEYPAAEKMWEYLAQQSGAATKRAEIPLPLLEEAQFTSALEEQLTDRTRVLFLSHITSATALRFPIERIVAIARERGIITVIDGAHVPGQLPLALEELGADYYVGNLHKWMLTPKGTGILHARREMQGLLEPLIIGHGWTPAYREEGAIGGLGGPRYVDEIEMRGTEDPAPFLAIPAALRFRAEHDWDSVVDHCASLVDDAAARISEMTGLPLLSAREFRAPQMVSIPLPECEVLAVQEALRADWLVEAPVRSWRGRCLLRVSVQGYNSKHDIDRLVEVLPKVLPL